MRLIRAAVITEIQKLPLGVRALVDANQGITFYEQQATLQCSQNHGKPHWECHLGKAQTQGSSSLSPWLTRQTWSQTMRFGSASTKLQCINWIEICRLQLHKIDQIFNGNIGILLLVESWVNLCPANGIINGSWGNQRQRPEFFPLAQDKTVSATCSCVWLWRTILLKVFKFSSSLNRMGQFYYASYNNLQWYLNREENWWHHQY